MVLAAGRSTRFGATKQLARLDGRALVAHAIEAVRSADAVGPIVVVVGHDADRVTAAVGEAGSGSPVEVAVNPGFAAGQAGSLRLGLDALAEHREVEVGVVVLGDEPGLAPAVIDAVVAAVQGGAPAARARYLDAPGHPVGFARSVWPRLRGLTGDHGAGGLLDELGIVEVAVDRPRPRDIDTPADLDRLADL